jgi:hypothetical protein
MREVFERLIFHLNSKQSFVRFASGRLGCTVGVRMPRPIPRNWRFYQGSNWWCLARPAIETYLGYRREKPQYLRWFFERTLVPDEGIYQTLLLNAPGLEFSKTDIRYIRWDDRNSGSPAILGMRDLPELRASGRYFARKFDIEVDAAVFDALDTRCRDD